MAYNSNDGFSTKIWGPATWHFLRCVSFNYPVEPSSEQKNQYAAFVRSLGDVLPCGACRRNFKKNLEQVNFSKESLRTRDSFSRFIYALEEKVNQMTKDEQMLPKTFEQRRETYECFRAKCGKTHGKEAGCIQPRSHVASRALIRVVPVNGYEDEKSFVVSGKCKEKIKR